MFGLNDKNQNSDDQAANGTGTPSNDDPGNDNPVPESLFASQQPPAMPPPMSTSTDTPEPSYTLQNPYDPVKPADDTPSAPPSPPKRPSGTSSEDMIKMKQKALQSLAPLIDHLEQTPEEKFKTTMMLIQASDNAELVKEAYESANKIEDESKRAQALLDVVNEINYFTQNGKSTT